MLQWKSLAPFWAERWDEPMPDTREDLEHQLAEKMAEVEALIREEQEVPRDPWVDGPQGETLTLTEEVIENARKRRELWARTRKGFDELAAIHRALRTL